MHDTTIEDTNKTTRELQLTLVKRNLKGPGKYLPFNYCSLRDHRGCRLSTIPIILETAVQPKQQFYLRDLCLLRVHCNLLCATQVYKLLPFRHPEPLTSNSGGMSLLSGPSAIPQNDHCAWSNTVTPVFGHGTTIGMFSRLLFYVSACNLSLKLQTETTWQIYTDITLLPLQVHKGTDCKIQ